ncbi:MAG: N-acetyltransferase [Pseudonocardiales bacterium]|nr:MAG: N-acetyltransferase [Pseudonocardiales bacterium]
MTDQEHPPVVLVSVDDVVLEQLVHAATTDASADEVTAPVTAGETWTPGRVAWLRNFHRDRRAGLDGPTGEATWAVVIDKSVVGSVRLKRSDQPGVLETGAWLTRRARGRGVGGAAMAAVLRQAAALGAVGVQADTTAGNAAALGALRRLGFTLAPAEDGQGVHALILFGSPDAVTEHP